MLDCSRNAVMKPEKVKEFAKMISEMGYNMLQLYTEDTYEITDEPFFGYMRGRYNKEELKDIDDYCASIGIELVPCIQTLAHLGQLWQWDAYMPMFDCPGVLMAGEEKTYELIEKMFQTLSECFSSRRVNIGMDEAYFLGRGKYQDKHGYRNHVEILSEHLSRVKEIADKYGFSIMMWSDMFVRLCGSGDYHGENIQIPQETVDLVPEGVELIYWDYYSTEKEHYDEMFRIHSAFKNKIGFAGGLWTWTGYAPNLSMTQEIILPVMQSVQEHKINTVFFTMWGDNGKDCSFFTQLPMLFAVAKMAQGVFNEDIIHKEFEEKYGYTFEEFMKLELPNLINERVGLTDNPNKYLLFNDPFLRLYDFAVTDDLVERYQRASFNLKESINGRPYDYLFDLEKKLVDVLCQKGNLGVRLKDAYQSGDKSVLEKMVNKDFPAIISSIQDFAKAFRKMWLKENKPFGLEVQEARFGALMYRMEICAERIQSYLDGEIEQIDELEEETLVKSENFQAHNDYWSTITACFNYRQIT